MDPKFFRCWTWIIFLLLLLMPGDHTRKGSGEGGPPIEEDTQERMAIVVPLGGLLPGWLSAVTENLAFDHGVSPKLVKSIILTESNGDHLKVSPRGAKGLMQLMPVITKEYKVLDPHDPVANIQGGIQYLKSLLEEFSGDLYLVLAAYNAGPGAVRKYKGIPPFRETQEFVRKVSEIFHSGEESPHFPPPTLRVSQREALNRTPPDFMISGSPRSQGPFLKKLSLEPREVQNQ